jgi:2-polyprenyl-3-methyl-5-hydroxy-6-metoxy-1,4-benzoquinol methylase
MGDRERHLYDYDVDLEGGSAAARVVRMVGSKKRVLEIGAGPGSITRFLHARDNHVVALERDPSAIAVLRERCDEVVSADLNDASWASSLKQSFDVVVAADVLEHLPDPWAMLTSMKSLLSRGGSIVVSVPHASHACVIGCLLDEDFQYRDWGLLDRTHIRFFGLRNLQTMFADAGLKIVRGEFVIVPPNESEFRDQWRALDKSARKFLGAQRFAQVYQVVVTAAPIDDARPAVTLMDLDPASFGAKPLDESWAEGGLPGAARGALRALAGRALRR